MAVRLLVHVSRVAGYPPALHSPVSPRRTLVVDPLVNAVEGAPVFGRAVIVAAAAANREIVPVGSTLTVYWEGSDEWFDTRVLSHRAQLIDGQLFFKHQCEYDGGAIEHDLGLTDFHVMERAIDRIHIDKLSAKPPSYAPNYAVHQDADARPGEDVENRPSANQVGQGAATKQKAARVGHLGIRRAKPRALSKVNVSSANVSVRDEALYI